MPPSDPARLLPWDTEFWGLAIGRVEGETLDAERAHAVDEWADENAAACLYFLAASGDPPSAFAATEAGYRLVDLRVELGQELVARSDESSLRDATAEDLPSLRAIARASHRDTRFYADPNFPDERCDDFYGVWIERSVEGWADAVLVSNDADAYVTCHVDAERSRGSIGLIAVHERARGRGVGRELVRGALGWMRDNDLRDAGVVTQGRNVAAQRTFQSCGYRTESVGLWFHKWYAR